MRTVLSEAATATSTLPADIVKARLFQRIGVVLWSRGEKTEATVFFECAMQVAAKVTYGDAAQTRDPFASIGLIFDRALAGDFAGAVSHVAEFAKPELRDSARGEIVLATARRGEFDLAERILLSIEGTHERDEALGTLAMRAGGRKQFEIAERAARAIRDEIKRIQAISILAVDFSKDGQSERGASLLRETREMSRKLPSDDEDRAVGGAPQLFVYKFNSRDTMLGFVALQQLDAGLSSDSAETLSMIEDLPARAQVRHVLAFERDRQSSSVASPLNAGGKEKTDASDDSSSSRESAQLARSGNYAEAVALAERLDFFERISVLEEIAQIQVAGGETKLAVQWADRLPPPEKAHTLLAIAEAKANN